MAHSVVASNAAVALAGSPSPSRDHSPPVLEFKIKKNGKWWAQDSVLEKNEKWWIQFVLSGEFSVKWWTLGLALKQMVSPTDLRWNPMAPRL